MRWGIIKKQQCKSERKFVVSMYEDLNNHDSFHFFKFMMRLGVILAIFMYCFNRAATMGVNAGNMATNIVQKMQYTGHSNTADEIELH